MFMKFFIFLKPFLLKGTMTTRQFWPKVLIAPLAIISIHLDRMDDSASNITYHHLRPWFQGNLIHVNLDLNFHNGASTFLLQIEKMLDIFEYGDFQECVKQIDC